MLRILGSLRVGERRLRFRSQRAAELLGLLAISRAEGLLRGDAAALLWPEAEPDRAAHNLRQTLLYLREGLGEAIDHLRVDRERISLDGPVDAREFLRLVGVGPTAWDAAHALDTGRLLPGLEGEWVDRARVVHETARSRLLIGMSARARRENPVEALRLARCAVEADPLLESARRAAIEAHVAIGERASAVEEFAAYDRLLRAELGLAASPLLREIAFGEEIGEEISGEGEKPPLSPGARLAVAIGNAPRHEVTERYRSGCAALREALVGAPLAPPDARATATAWIARFEFAIGEWSDSVATARQALALAHGGGAAAFVRVQLARALAWTGGAEEALALAESALRAAKLRRDPELGAEALLMIGAAAWHRGDLALSARQYARAARWAVRSGATLQETRAHLSLASIRLRLEGPEAAIEIAARATESAARSGSASLNAHARGDLARYRESAGDLEGARRGYAAALVATEGGRNPLARSQTLTYMGDLETRLGHPDAARVHHEEAVALRRIAGDRIALATSLRGLGKALLELGRVPEARASLGESIRLFEASGATDALSTARLPLARALLAGGERREATLQARIALTEWSALDPVSREVQVPDASLSETAIAEFRTEFARTGIAL